MVSSRETMPPPTSFDSVAAASGTPAGREGRTLPEAVVQQALEQTNLRVCPETLEVVSVVPFPDASSPWAPKKLCTAAAP